MDFNFKILKYNITLALALSGAYYYKNPEQIDPHVQIVKEVGKTVVKKVIEDVPSVSEFRGLASVKNLFKNSKKTDESDNDHFSKKYPNLFEPPQEPGLKDFDIEEEEVAEEIPPIEKKPLKTILKEKDNLEEEEKKEEVISGGGGIAPTKEIPNPTTGGSGNGGSSCSKPTNPASLVVSLSANVPSLTWSLSVGASSYNVFRGTTSGSLTLITSEVTTNSYVDTSAPMGGTYYYKVSATNSCGHSVGHSNEDSASSLGVFSITSLVASEDQVIASWSNSTEALSYNLSYGTSPGVYSFTGANTSPATIALAGGQTYYFQVQAVGVDGSVTTAESSVYVPTSFTDNFNFNSSLVYNAGTGAEISSGVGRLEVSDLVSQKTLNGTGSVQEKVLDNYTFLDANLTLADDKVSLTSGVSGEYISQALDGKNSSTAWTKMKFNSSLPYGKELAITPETGYASEVTDFSQSLIALWHFNQGSYNNTANEVVEAKGVHHGTTLGTLPVTTGKFNKALEFNGGANYVSVNDHNELDNLTNLTMSLWVYPTLLDGNARGLISKRVSSGSLDHAYSLFFFTGNRLFVDIHTTNNRFSTNTIFATNNWYHIVVVFDGTAPLASRVKVYINGVLDSTVSESSSSIPATAANLYLGSLNLAYGSYYHGKMDETALWAKSLSENEVKELYRRGANRIKLQTRTCTDLSGYDCAGTITDWVGPDGTNTTYFSELDNNTILNSTGVVSNSPFSNPFSFFTAGLTAWLGVGTNSTNQYIQYKAVLESDTILFYPDFSSVSFEPVQRYLLSSSVFGLASAAINFSTINGLTITQTCGDADGDTLEDDIRYELSFNGGSNYYSFVSGAWVTSMGFNTANTKAELEALTASDFSLAPTSTGSLLVRTYLTSSGVTACQVDNIQIQGSR